MACGGGVTHIDGCIPTPFMLASKWSKSLVVKLIGSNVASSLRKSIVGVLSKASPIGSESYGVARLGKREVAMAAFALCSSSCPAPSRREKSNGCCGPGHENVDGDGFKAMGSMDEVKLGG